MSFVTCLKQATALSEKDRSTLHELAGQNRAAGMTPTAAAAKAVSEYAQTVKVQRAQADAAYEQATTLAQSATIRSGKETLEKYGLKPGGKYNTRDIAAALEARQREKYGKIDPTDRSPESIAKIAAWMAEEVRFEMQHPRKSGVGWYSRKYQRALDIMGTVFPELTTSKDARSLMTALIAIASDGQKVVPNFRMAMDLYATFKDTGNFTTERGHARGASVRANAKVIQDLYAKYGPKGMHKYLMQEATVSELRQIAKAEGIDFSTEYQAHIKLPMAAVLFGPKLGAFYANLMGAHGYLTMDRWWSRTFNRYRGTLLTAPTPQGLARFKELSGHPEWSDDEAIAATVKHQASYEAKGFKDGTEIEKAANTIHKAAFTALEDAPFNATDRTFMLDAVGKAQETLAAEGRKISIADIQAVLWYYEKRLYGELGARQSADVSYEEAANLVAAEYADARATGRPVAQVAGKAAAVDDAGAVGGEDHKGDPVGLEQFEPDAGKLAQSAGEKPLATFNPATLTIALGKGANLSSFLHESGHFYLEVLADIASQEGAPQQITDDMSKLMQWFGVQDAATWQTMTLDEKRPYHERFAESFEQYLMEGKAPSVELQPVFQRIRAWLIKVYSSVKEFLASRGVAEAGGQALGQAPTASAFMQWFGDSKVVDSEGKPLVVYHGTNKDIGIFEPRRGAIWFAEDHQLANDFVAGGRQSIGKPPGKGATVYPVYLRIANPLDLTEISLGDTVSMAEILRAAGAPHDDATLAAIAQANLDRKYVFVAPQMGDPVAYLVNQYKAGRRLSNLLDDRSLIDALKAAGVDGLHLTEEYEIGPKRAKVPTMSDTWAVFDSEQIKSATGNRGTYDPNDPNILAQGGPSQASQIQLSDEIRGVFDRLLATDEQIRQAEEIAGMLPDEKATNAAIEELQAKSLQDMKWLSGAKSKYLKALQAEARVARKETMAEVTAEVNAYPVVQAKAALDAAIEAHDADPLAADLNVQVISDTFGFPSIDAMHQAIEQFGDKASAIKELTDQRMLEAHGELIDPQAMEDAANAAVHNQMRARVLASELKAQTDALGTREQTGVGAKGQRLTVNVLLRAAKSFAQTVIGKTRIADLRKTERDHINAERRAGTRWAEATKKADTLGAVRAKKDQALNNAVVVAAVDARAEVQKTLQFFKRVLNGSPEKVTRGGRDVDIVNAMREVLAAYGYTQRSARSAGEYMEIVRQHDPELAEYLRQSIEAALKDAKPISELTVTELRVLDDMMQTMWNKAQRSKQMEVAGKLIAMDDAEDALLARAAEIKAPPRPGETSALTVKDQIATFIQAAGSLMRRAESWAEGMDGKWGGPFLRYVFQPVKMAADKYRDSRVKMQKQYQELIDEVAPFMTGETIAATRDGEINYTFGAGINGIGHSELLHAILHTGNESNKRKLLLGRKWAVENPDGSLDTSRWDRTIARMQEDGTLRKEHYDFVQKVWDLLESMKGPAQEAHRTVYGFYFEEIKADEVVTPFGTYRGGYVPAQADPRLVDDQAMRELSNLENENLNFVMPSTGRGFTKSRVEYNVKLMLDLQTLAQHIDKVLKFTHMQPAITDVNRLLQRQDVSNAINAIDSTIIHGMLAPWLARSARQIVEEPIAGDGGVSRIATFARANAGMALMVANASNTLQQVTGFSNALAKLKADGLEHHMMRATAQFIASPAAMKAAVAENSSFMAHRMENEVAAILDSTRKILLNAGLYTKTKMWVREHAFFMQAAMDNAIGPIVWTAAYNAMLEKTASMADATAYADGVVRQTQGSSLPEDVARSETGNAYLRILNQFTGYWNMMANASSTQLKQTAEELGMRRGAGKMLMIVTLGSLVPIWVAEAIAQAMRGGPDDPDGDGWLYSWLVAVFGFGTIKGMLAMVPVVGPTANAALNAWNSKPYDDRISMSPAISVAEGAVGAPHSIYKAIVDDGSAQKAVRDSGALLTLLTGLPFSALARPLGYMAGVQQGKIAPTGPVDAARGMVTGVASPESKQ